MTDKAQAILEKMKLRRLFPSRSPLSGTEPVSNAGGDEDMAVLKESNDLEEGHDAFVKSLAWEVNVLN